VAAPSLLAGGCARPQQTQEQVAGPTAPPDLRRAAPPPGGQAMSATGAGAGGSAAGGMQNQVGRIGGIAPSPVVTAPHGDEISPMRNRMSPTTDNVGENYSSSGSGTGDTGRPIPPEVSLAVPADKAVKVQLAPANNNPPSRGPAAKPQPRPGFGAANNPANSLPGQ